MLSFLKTKKSAGVRVTPAVHRLIARANEARDSGDWEGAAELYRAAVTADPSLVHIWVQLGHAEKERHRLDEAEAAYTRASLLAPRQAEPLLHLGHAYKVMGDISGAARSYLRAARLNPTDAHAVEELQHIISRTSVLARPDLIALLRSDISRQDDSVARNAASASAGDTLLFDVSGLIAQAFSGHSLNDAGLVGQHLLPALLPHSDRPTMMCAHVVGHGRWIAISQSQLDAAIALGQKSGKAAATWNRALSDLDLSLLLSEPFEMPRGALLVDLDASHAPPDHALFVRHARDTHGVRYLAFGSSPAADLQLQSDLHVTTASQDLTAELVRQTLSKAVPVRSDQTSHIAQSARLESLGSDGSALLSRVGTGWLPPERWGCWIGMSGADLEITLPALSDPRIYLQLKALPSVRTHYRLSLTDGRQIQGEIEASRRKWIVMDDLPVQDGVFKLRIRGDDSQPVRLENLDRKLPVSLGVTGFYICDRNDRAARLALLEASMLGDPETLH